MTAPKFPCPPHFTRAEWQRWLEDRLTDAEATAFLKRSRGHLANMRSERRGPRYRKAEDGRITYRRADLIAWEGATTVTPELDARPATTPGGGER